MNRAQSSLTACRKCFEVGGGNGKAHLTRILEARGRRGAESSPPFEPHHFSLSLKTFLGCLESEHLSKRKQDGGSHPHLGGSPDQCSTPSQPMFLPYSVLQPQAEAIQDYRLQLR